MSRYLKWIHLEIAIYQNVTGIKDTKIRVSFKGEILSEDEIIPIICKYV